MQIFHDFVATKTYPIQDISKLFTVYGCHGEAEKKHWQLKLTFFILTCKNFYTFLCRFVLDLILTDDMTMAIFILEKNRLEIDTSFQEEQN